MKRITCNSCKKHWILENNDVHFLKNCPFCGISTVKQIDLRSVSVQSFQEAVLLAMQTLGEDILLNPTRLSSFIMDIEPKYSKELRIFKRVIANEYSSNINEMYGKDSNELNILISKYRQILVENEGLSDEWLDIICSALRYCFINLYHPFLQKLDNVRVENEGEQPSSINHGIVDNISIPEKLQEYLSKDGSFDFKRFIFDISHRRININNLLASIYFENGDYREAWMWYKHSADAKDKEGEYFTALFFENGYHVKKDIKAAKTYYKRSASKGYLPAVNAVERLKQVN